MAVGQKKIISSTTFTAKIVSNCIKHSKYDITHIIRVHMWLRGV